MYSAVGMKECGSVSVTPRYSVRPSRLNASLRKDRVPMAGLVLLPLSRVEIVSMGKSSTSASQEKRPEASAVIAA